MRRGVLVFKPTGPEAACELCARHAAELADVTIQDGNGTPLTVRICDRHMVNEVAAPGRRPTLPGTTSLAPQSESLF